MDTRLGNASVVLVNNRGHGTRLMIGHAPLTVNCVADNIIIIQCRVDRRHIVLYGSQPPVCLNVL